MAHEVCPIRMHAAHMAGHVDDPQPIYASVTCINEHCKAYEGDGYCHIFRPRPTTDTGEAERSDTPYTDALRAILSAP